MTTQKFVTECSLDNHSNDESMTCAVRIQTPTDAPYPSRMTVVHIGRYVFKYEDFMEAMKAIEYHQETLKKKFPDDVIVTKSSTLPSSPREMMRNHSNT